MRILEILALTLMAVGTVMTVFVRKIIDNPLEKINPKGNGDDGGILSKAAMIFKITGFVLVIIGFILFFIDK